MPRYSSNTTWGNMHEPPLQILEYLTVPASAHTSAVLLWGRSLGHHLHMPPPPCLTHQGGSATPPAPPNRQVSNRSAVTHACVPTTLIDADVSINPSVSMTFDSPRVTWSSETLPWYTHVTSTIMAATEEQLEQFLVKNGYDIPDIDEIEASFELLKEKLHGSLSDASGDHGSNKHRPQVVCHKLGLFALGITGESSRFSCQFD